MSPSFDGSLSLTAFPFPFPLDFLSSLRASGSSSLSSNSSTSSCVSAPLWYLFCSVLLLFFGGTASSSLESTVVADLNPSCLADRFLVRLVAAGLGTGRLESALVGAVDISASMALAGGGGSCKRTRGRMRDTGGGGSMSLGKRSM